MIGCGDLQAVLYSGIGLLLVVLELSEHEIRLGDHAMMAGNSYLSKLAFWDDNLRIVFLLNDKLCELQG